MGTSGAKSDAGDAHALADMVRTDAHQLRTLAGDSPLVDGLEVLARSHQNLIWNQRQVMRLRSALREYFPAAMTAFDDLTAHEAVELLLTAAPDPASGRRCRAHESRRHCAGPTAVTSRRRLRGCRSCCAPSTSPTSPRPWSPATPRPCGRPRR